MTKIRSILVASDLTEASDPVVRAAGEIAAAKGAELHVLHAFDLPSGTSLTTADPASASFPGRIREAEKALDRQLERAVPAKATVATRTVEIYVAHKAIADCAERVSADLIVVGSHSHRRLGDELLGSTADRVIRTAEVPCLIVRAPLALPLRSVVVPIDRSQAALGALQVAMAWSLVLGDASATGAPAALTVLHVLPKAFDIPEFSVDPEEIGAELHEQVREARERVRDAGALEVREEIRWADSAVDEIVRFTTEETADLVVVGTHGHGVLKRFLIGSVASGVARRASCAVLLVPPALWQEEEQDRGAAGSASGG